MPDLPSAKRRKEQTRLLQEHESVPSSPSASRSSSPLPSSPLSSPPLHASKRKEKSSTIPLEKKKEIQPLDLNLQRWQRINKYVTASQHSTLMLTQFTICEEDVAKHLLSEDESQSSAFVNIHLAIAIGRFLLLLQLIAAKSYLVLRCPS